jgi:hypothetical protein
MAQFLSTVQRLVSTLSSFIWSFFFTEQCSWRPLMDGLSFDSINEAEVSWLEREFED